MRKNGFTLLEIIIVIAVIGILAMIAFSMLNTSDETRLIKCNADMEAYITMTEQIREQTPGHRAPTREEMYGWMEREGKHRDPHFHYVPNNSDHNKGHGNDLDLCDEENPGKSLDNRECLDVLYVWVCDHNHTDLAKYVFGSNTWGPVIVPLHQIANVPKGKGKSKSTVSGEAATQYGNGDEFLRSLEYWRLKDPNLQKWIGR